MPRFFAPVSPPALAFMLALAPVLLSCSSAPKSPPEVFTTRRMARTQLELANNAADRARYDDALFLLEEARRLAVSADDPDLRIRTSLSRGNILFYLGRREEANAEWNAALREAGDAKDSLLSAACRVYLYRAALLSGESAPGEIAYNTRSELPALKNDRLFTALAWTVIGLAEKARLSPGGSKNAAIAGEAERAILSALEIHLKANCLELAAYDWYLVASIRSVAGNHASALDALQNAIAFDRRAENPHGLGSDYLAQGDVRRKMNDPAGANAAYKRAEEIFLAANMESEARRARSLQH
jgi:tetratricopeptide (TPR) repeat protein